MVSSRSSHNNSTNQGLTPSAFAAVTFLFGLFLGGLLPKYPSGFSAPQTSVSIKSTSQQHPITNGAILRISDVPFRSTAHVDSKGKPIVKQMLLEPFVVPNFSGFALATFEPGQDVEIHTHKTMHEFFYVIEGDGYFKKNGVDHQVTNGTFLHMAPQESHSVWVPEDAKGPMKLIVCGVTIGDKR
mmetsp:Transcript_15897/g.23076  ORF Transcript_15897/g.23076 Transcript_15897/m.23076 type:complete len:185 (+) Transcript_15897:39-593(+)